MDDPYTHPDVDEIIAMALAEDLRGAHDITCGVLVEPEARLKGVVRAKSPGVVCGLALFARVFAVLGGGVELDAMCADGTRVEPGQEVMRLIGRATTILIGERTALNLCQRLSGTASLTRRLVDAVAGTTAAIFDTRKTTPGLRHLQKYAVRCGGGRNLRHGLYDQVLIKDNHIALMSQGTGTGSPAEAVRRCRQALGPDVVVEVEIESLQELEGVILAGANIVLLDNMGIADMAEAVRRRGSRPVELEASGGITAATIREVAQTGVDRISVGALTHSAPALDLSLRCQPV